MPADEGTVDEQTRQQRVMEELADTVVRRGLAGPAVTMLEALRPLIFIGSQFMHGLSPMVSIMFETANWNAIAQLLEERSSVDRLIEMIEKREQESSQANS